MTLKTSNCFLILGDDTSFFFFIFFLFFLLLLLLLLLFYVIINFKKYIFHFFIFFRYFFYEFFFIFSCSGMFRNVPECSMFRVLSTAINRNNIRLFHFTISGDRKIVSFFYLYSTHLFGFRCSLDK